MDRKLFGIFGFALIFSSFCGAFKLPSTPEVCESMIPKQSQGLSPQKSESPYLLKVSHTHIKSGAHFEITIKTNSNSSDEVFRGFMIQVRNNFTNKPFGMFVRTTEAKWLYCSPGKKNVLANNNEKERVIVKTTWACPPRFKGYVYARATIMRDEKEFWVGHDSHLVNIGPWHGVRIKEFDIN